MAADIGIGSVVWIINRAIFGENSEPNNIHYCVPELAIGQKSVGQHLTKLKSAVHLSAADTNEAVENRCDYFLQFVCHFLCWQTT